MSASLGVERGAASETPTNRHVQKNVRLLDSLLIEAMGDLDGRVGVELIARVRDAAVASESEGGQALDRLLTGLSTDQAVYLARAFACHALLTQIGEDVAGRRRHAEFELDSRPVRPQTLSAAVDALLRDCVGKGALREALERMNLVEVLTAHPTEMRRRSVVDREYEIARLLSLRRHHLPRDIDTRLQNELYREIAILWQTRLNRPERITVDDEIRNMLSIVGRSILPAMVELYQNWAAAIGPELGEGEDFPSLLRMGTWIGGDRDGHPYVDAERLRNALRGQAWLLFGFYRQELEKLQPDLSISSTLAPVSDGVLRLAEMSGDDSVHRVDEPYRRAVVGIERRLMATGARLSGAAPAGPFEPYASPEAFIADLETIRASLVAHGGPRLVGATLKSLIQMARGCGFHLLTIDLRQNSDVHERVVAELFRRSAGVDYLALDEDARIALLVGELAHERPLRSPFAAYSDETRKELAVVDAAAEAVRLFGAQALGAYVVSKSASVSDILEPYLLLKEAGLLMAGAKPASTLRVSPLFETIEDLQAAPQIIARGLSLPTARELLGAEPLQEVMLGYSDSNKDGGYAASRHGVMEGASAIAAECRKAGVAVQFFHGRGGSVGRGGGPAAEAVQAQPPGTVGGRIRLTEQGEMIARKFGDQPTARRNLDSLAAAVLWASNRPADAVALEPRFDAAMLTAARESFAAYRALVYDDPAFEDFFWAATPIAEIADLKIGSRPASRKASRRIEDLRAIPWVFSWSQARFMLPGWYGFASGVRRAGLSSALLQEMAGGWDFFASLLSNMELALAQSNMGIAERYAALAPDKAAARRIFGAIRQEWEEAAALVLSLRGGAQLLDGQPELAESVALNARYVDPLNHLQLELLARRRGGDQSEGVRLGVQLTVNGIAAGLRNTG